MRADPTRPPRVLFLWESSAGHLANLRRFAPRVEAHGDIDAHVVRVPYWQEDGWLERRGLGSVAARIRPFAAYRTWLRAEPWDAVFSNSAGARGNAGLLARFPSVLDADATGAQMAAMPEYDMARRGPDVLRSRGEKRLLDSVTLVSAWSRWAADGHVAAGADPDKIVINPPGVDLDLWHPPTGEIPRATDDKIRIVFVGGDFVRKGGYDLLEWFRSQHDPRLELHLVTPTDVEASPGVTIHRLSESDPAMQELVRSAHVSVLPSRAECFGIASLEALASGVPVVQTDVGGAPDIIVPGETGELIAPARPSEIGAAVTSILADPGRYDAMRSAARADAERRFGLQRNVDATVAMVLDAIERRARADAAA